jgi:DNA-binding transcriptional regulator YdaS (Cro superfamily)
MTMKLRSWLNENDLTYEEFSKTLGISKNTLKNVGAGLRRPSEELMELIEKLTKGQVTPKEMIEFCREGPRKTKKKHRLKKYLKISRKKDETKKESSIE